MLELIWIAGTLFTVSLIASIARKWGPNILVAMVAICIVVANILAVKVIKMFGFMVPAGVIVYSISFLLTDIISEFFGKKEAIRAILIGFISTYNYAIIFISEGNRDVF